MDKLVGLINDYELTLPRNRRVIRNAAAIKTTPEIVISNDYGFAAWLVNNDKIDFDKCGLDIKDYLSYNKRYNKGIVMAENYNNDTFVVREFYSPYEQLLMLLSIQKKPIDYLISILK